MTKKAQLTNDGERMIPEFHKGNIMYGEHLGRYMAMDTIVSGRDVLDIASGSGYGTKHISMSAKKVYGVDVSEEAIEYAKLHYGAKNVQYKVGSGTNIPLDDDSVDVVVSMETIEHIEDQESFLKEVRRVLRPDGVFVVSTPNDKVYPKGNHFHVREHDKQSLASLLKGCFSQIDFYYQVTAIAASIHEESELGQEDAEIKWAARKLYGTKPDDSIYYIVVCGESKVLPKIQGNTLLSQEFSHLEQKKLADYIGDLQAELDNLRQNLDHELKQVKQLTEELKLIKSTKAWQLNTKVAALKSKVNRRK